MPILSRSLLRTRLFPILFALAALPVAGVGWLFYGMSLRSVESVLARQSLDAARAGAARIAAEFPGMKAESGMPARSRSVRRYYRDRAGQQSALDQQTADLELQSYTSWFLDETQGRYAQVIYLDTAGEPLFKRDTGQTVQDDLDLLIAPTFEPGDRNGRPTSGEKLRLSVQETNNHGAVLRFARPVQASRKSKEALGYLLLDVPLQQLLPQRISGDIALLLAEQTSGQILYSSDKSLPGSPLAAVLPELAFASANGDSSGSINFTYHQQAHLASYTSLAEPAWTIAAIIATEPYTAGPRRTGFYTLAATALFILVSGTLIFLLIRRVQERTLRLEEVNLQLEEQNIQIQQATRHKSDFLARMSHDLRTPMNAIIGYTRILLRRAVDKLEPRQLQNLENIETSAQNLLALINEILDLSRIEAGRVEVHAEDVNVQQLIAECTTSVAPLIKPEVELIQDLADAPALHTDADLLRRVIMNILGNAVKFTEAGSITLALKAADKGIELSITDTGPGIPAEQLPHIFDEFRQVEGAVKTQEGSGLGLAIVKKTVKLLAGTIRAESTIGEGTTFTLQINNYTTN